MVHFSLDKYKKYTYSEQFAVYLIKRMEKLHTYYKNDFIIRDSTERYKAMGKYKRTYQQKFIQVRKNKNNKELAKDFEKCKK